MVRAWWRRGVTCWTADICCCCCCQRRAVEFFLALIDARGPVGVGGDRGWLMGVEEEEEEEESVVGGTGMMIQCVICSTVRVISQEYLFKYHT